MMASSKVERRALHVPDLQQVAQVLQDGLQAHFARVAVTVTDCPDLRKEPYLLAAEGIGGKPRLTDVGGVPYLLPSARPDKVYNLCTVAEQIDLPEGFLLGAGCGPCHVVGVNCELMPNIKTGANVINDTYFAKIDKDGGCFLDKLNHTDFCILANMYACEGKPGKVLEVRAAERVGTDNFVSAMRSVLKARYGEKPVGMGGVFLVARGNAKLHIMPTFSTVPLLSNEDVNRWLMFYTASAPLTCLSTFISHDPGLDLRVEHTHCFSQHGQGGHYHEDTTPDEAEYVGYFNVAEFIYRVDAPADTHLYGRD